MKSTVLLELCSWLQLAPFKSSPLIWSPKLFLSQLVGWTSSPPHQWHCWSWTLSTLEVAPHLSIHIGCLFCFAPWKRGNLLRLHCVPVGWKHEEQQNWPLSCWLELVKLVLTGHVYVDLVAVRLVLNCLWCKGVLGIRDSLEILPPKEVEVTVNSKESPRCTTRN